MTTTESGAPAAPTPATQEIELRAEVLPPVLSTMQPSFDDMARLGQWLAALEGASPDQARGAKGMAAAFRVWVATALDLGPAAVGDVYVIDNRVAISAQLMRALAERAGYRVEAVASDEHSCTAALFYGDVEVGRSSFSMDEARSAGLADKKNWKTYPRRMLWARASAYAIRDHAPGIALGLRTTEEMGADVDVVEPEPETRAPGAYDEPVIEHDAVVEWEELSDDERAALTAEEPEDRRLDDA